MPLGVNDYSGQNTTTATLAQPGTIPTTYGANLQTFVNTVLGANTNCSILLVGEGRAFTIPSPETYKEAEYYAQAKAIAQVTDHVAFLDIGDTWGSFAASNSNGLNTTNSAHPSQKGHADMGRILFNALSLSSVM